MSKADKLWELAMTINQMSNKDDEKFRLVLKNSVYELNLGANDIARQFDTDWATVERWMEGVCLPSSQVREHVLLWLLESLVAARNMAAS